MAEAQNDFVVWANDFSHIFSVGYRYLTDQQIYVIAFYKSTNSGGTWTTSSLPLNGYGLAIAVDPANENVIYIGGYCSQPYRGVIFKSTNGGTSWTEITGVIQANVNALAIDPLHSNHIYAGTNSGLYQSENSGASWSLLSNHPTLSIALNKNVPAQIYIGGSQGIKFSNDRGASWLDFNGGLTDLNILSLSYDPAFDLIYAGTASGGVFRNSSQLLLQLSCSSGGVTVPSAGTLLYHKNASVQITATPNANYIFLGWTGDASGSANPLTFVMDTDKSIRANFQHLIYAPSDFAGEKKANRSLLQIEYANRLTWTNNANNADIISHKLYLVNGEMTLMAEIPVATSMYIHNKVVKDQEYRYALTAVNNEGREGLASFVTVK